MSLQLMQWHLISHWYNGLCNVIVARLFKISVLLVSVDYMHSAPWSDYDN